MADSRSTGRPFLKNAQVCFRIAFQIKALTVLQKGISFQIAFGSSHLKRIPVQVWTDETATPETWNGFMNLHLSTWICTSRPESAPLSLNLHLSAPKCTSWLVRFRRRRVIVTWSAFCFRTNSFWHNSHFLNIVLNRSSETPLWNPSRFQTWTWNSKCCGQLAWNKESDSLEIHFSVKLIHI